MKANHFQPHHTVRITPATEPNAERRNAQSATTEGACKEELEKESRPAVCGNFISALADLLRQRGEKIALRHVKS
jgi:hypothetical protein